MSLLTRKIISDREFHERMENLRHRCGQKGAIAGMIDDIESAIVPLLHMDENQQAVNEYLKRLRESK